MRCFNEEKRKGSEVLEAFYAQKYKKEKMTITTFFSTFQGLLSEIMRNKD